MTLSYTEPCLVASPSEVDPLEAIVRRGAREMLQAALEREVEEFLGPMLINARLPKPSFVAIVTATIKNAVSQSVAAASK